MLKRFFIILAFALLLSPANAASRHGFNQTWNGNLFGGGWVCFNAIVTGCSQAFNAVCSPTGASGDDAAALNSFNTYFAAQAPATVKLYIAPGSVCHTEGSTTNIGGSGTSPLIIWAFGARISNQNIGGADFIQDAVHNAKIATVSAGTRTVTLVTPSQYSRFAVGDQAFVGGLSLQTYGYPPNFQLAEYKVITAVTTNCPAPCTSSTITLDTPLANSYKSTWPDLGIGDNPTPLGGPGMLYSLSPTFGINLQVYGLSVMVDATPANGSNVVNKNIYFYGVNHEGAGWGLRGQNITLVNTSLPGATEFDKNIENVTCISCYSNGNGFFFQQASPRNLRIVNSTSMGRLNGTGQNAIVTNSSFSDIAAGVAGFGAATNVTLTGVKFATPHTYYHYIAMTDLTFSAGTFTILKSAGTIANVYATFVPGFKYYLGGVAGNIVCNPVAEFTVTDLREDATHVFIDIDQSSLPACGGGLGAVLSYGQFHALTASQTGGGPGSIFSDAEMIP